ncbi:MAG TPA: PEP/pyruvate-binding domain-containing protein [Candidatus Polarisedimenticolia bacterium]|nr:PEP/pyruvate-binding domain-containing protein [Candidatus Polarisedimenticolia bacterium]
MTTPDSRTRKILDDLQERAKELNCLYRVDEILSRRDRSNAEIIDDLLEAIPAGWKYPETCRGAISLGDETWPPGGGIGSPWRLSADIQLHGEKVGEITVYYTQEHPHEGEGPFLPEERRLIHAIAERIGLFVMQQRLRSDHASWETAVRGIASDGAQPWKVLLDFLQRTDPNLLKRFTRKMINHLCWTGVREAQTLLRESLQEFGPEVEAQSSDENLPLVRRQREDDQALTTRTFDLAARHLSEAEMISRIQGWFNEEKSTFLIKSLENPGTGLADLAEAVERYQDAGIDEKELPIAVRMSLKVALIRRFFVDSLEFINVAKEYIDIEDFYDLVKHLIFPSRSQGKLGGKGAGLFLATQALRKAAGHADVLANLRIPKTWYVASDAILEFIQYNDLNEVYNRKYMEIERVRQDYPHIIQLFKNSDFPPEITKGLAAALDDFEDTPIIVRSSSLLEDRVGSAFSGKYKSLFLGNQGTKKERLRALQDAIAEVYASVFGPDPIGYRAEKGLIDFREEMGILIQEVVGRRHGGYYFPAYSGVGFSSNNFRWSPRIRREDGLLRIVPGLGTRAVDRLTDDYPVLLAPGQPTLRVNVTADEVIRYAPKKIDVINLERNVFETVEAEALLRECGPDMPFARDLISMVDGDRVRRPVGLEPDWRKDDFVVTCEGLISRQSFILQMQTLLRVLHERLAMPVDIEFASDGKDMFLVQCRAQSHSTQHQPAPIPRDLPKKKIVFSAHRYITNGVIPNVTHIVYVDPEEYAKLETQKDMRDVGRAIGRLNKLLPRRQFILVGPGRWGSRGDIRLGVSVTYSDINNTAALLEVARKKGDYLPELSFGTHFFQDLVESDIRYIPLYPDDPGIVFNERFFTRSHNVLPEILPEFAYLAGTIHVVDVPRQTGGEVLQILLNSDLDEALAVLGKPGGEVEPSGQPAKPTRETESYPEDHWRWRQRMAKRIAASLDPERFGVRGLYLFGSTKNATAGPASDLDLIVHFAGTAGQRSDLEIWLEGWSISLDESNYLRTGYSSGGLLDVHFVTDEDIARQTSYAAKIGAVTDAARPLAMGLKGADPGVTRTS